MNEADKQAFYKLATGLNFEALLVTTHLERQQKMVCLTPRELQKHNRGDAPPKFLTNKVIALSEDKPVASFIQKAYAEDPSNAPVAFYLVKDNLKARGGVDVSQLFVVGSVMPHGFALEVIDHVITGDKNAVKGNLTEDTHSRIKRTIGMTPLMSMYMPVVWAAKEVVDRSGLKIDFVLPSDNTTVVNQKGQIVYFFKSYNPKIHLPNHAFLLPNDDGIVVEDVRTGWGSQYIEGVYGAQKHFQAVSDAARGGKIRLSYGLRNAFG